MRDIRFQEIKVLIKSRVPYQVPFYPNMVGAHLLISWPTGSVLEHFFQKLHETIQSNPLDGFSSRILGSAILPPWVDFFLQRDDSAGQPMGGYADSSQIALFQGIDLVG
jgi:hypothetical protein